MLPGCVKRAPTLSLRARHEGCGVIKKIRTQLIYSLESTARLTHQHASIRKKVAMHIANLDIKGW